MLLVLTKSFTILPRCGLALSSWKTAFGPICCKNGNTKSLKISSIYRCEFKLPLTMYSWVLRLTLIPAHHRSFTEAVMLSYVNVSKTFPLASIDMDTTVIEFQIKSGFVWKTNISPLTKYPSQMRSAPFQTKPTMTSS
jgi:hypothetical protein